MKKIVIILMLAGFFIGCITPYNKPQSTNTYNPPPPSNNVKILSLHDISHIVDKDRNIYFILGIDECPKPEELVTPEITMTLEPMLTRNAIYIIPNVISNQGFNVIDVIYDTTDTDNLFTVLIYVTSNNLDNRKAIAIGIYGYNTGLPVWTCSVMLSNPQDYADAQEKFINNMFSLYKNKTNMDESRHW